MKIQWILGLHDNWPSAYQPYLLTPSPGQQDEEFEWQWSLHHATIVIQARTWLENPSPWPLLDSHSVDASTLSSSPIFQKAKNGGEKTFLGIVVSDPAGPSSKSRFEDLGDTPGGVPGREKVV